jgi:hypothetical protein
MYRLPRRPSWRFASSQNESGNLFRIEESTCNGLHSIRASVRLLEEGVDDLAGRLQLDASNYSSRFSFLAPFAARLVNARF